MRECTEADDCYFPNEFADIISKSVLRYQHEVDEQMEGGDDVNVMRNEEGVYTASEEETNDDQIYNTDEKSSEFEQETLEIYVCENCYQEFDR